LGFLLLEVDAVAALVLVVEVVVDMERAIWKEEMVDVPVNAEDDPNRQGRRAQARRILRGVECILLILIMLLLMLTACILQSHFYESSYSRDDLLGLLL
jgi:hypothetical protein